MLHSAQTSQLVAGYVVPNERHKQTAQHAQKVVTSDPYAYATARGTPIVTHAYSQCAEQIPTHMIILFTICARVIAMVRCTTVIRWARFVATLRKKNNKRRCFAKFRANALARRARKAEETRIKDLKNERTVHTLCSLVNLRNPFVLTHFS